MKQYQMNCMSLSGGGCRVIMTDSGSVVVRRFLARSQMKDKGEHANVHRGLQQGWLFAYG